MIQKLQSQFEEYRNSIYGFLRQLTERDKAFLLQTEIWAEFKEYCENTNNSKLKTSPLAQIIDCAQEAIISPPWISFAIRPKVANWQLLRFHIETADVELIDISTYLMSKERIIHPDKREDDWTLEIDLSPFNREFPKIREPRSIGKGVEFLNRYLSNRMFEENKNGNHQLLQFLRMHEYNGRQLMINDRIVSPNQLIDSLRTALDYLDTLDPNAQWDDAYHQLQNYGFEPGWGRDVSRMTETFSLLVDIFEAPDPETLGLFLSRIPMIFNLVVLSPHGYFAQSNVLGMPDTGGQVVYILDQVKALEKEMHNRLWEQGIDIEPTILIITRLIPDAGTTTCNEHEEKILGSNNVKIIRVPFRNEHGEILSHWISRFHIWPHLERFSIEVEKTILGELGTRPDLIIGNYSDGNLVASLLAKRLGVTQCNIAHALEKSKYLYSDLYWEDHEENYHFSCQFTADLIAMNTADFILTSTYQEIAGNTKSVGQYESYSFFTMPYIYRVVNGVDVFDPKFNIVSPGADPTVFFPYTAQDQRLTSIHDKIDELIYGQPNDSVRGQLEIKDKPLIFSMSRFDHIKNITGLVQWYAEHPELQNEANLLIIGGYTQLERSKDAEEQKQIQKMHHLMDEYGLDRNVRWLGMQLDKTMVGEIYRYVADCKGVFVQPALFEAFGLTVIEAMATGLPPFATKYGGPLEIINDGQSGFHIDPNEGREVTNRLLEFFQRCQKDDTYWNRISKGAIERTNDAYNWKLYAERLMNLSRIYGFWKYVSDLERAETRRYLEMIYGLIFRERANQIQ